MKPPVDFSMLEQARKAMGAPKADVNLSLDTDRPVREDIFQVDILPDDPWKIKPRAGLLTYDEKQIILYIKTPRADVEELSKKPADKPRFHFANCKTLEDMKDKNRYDRYVVTNQRHEDFDVYPYDHTSRKRGELMQARLGPCMNCLKFLNYQDYAIGEWAKKKEIFNDFSLEEFFAEYTPIFKDLPRHSHLSSTDEDYPSNWAAISSRVRRENNWRCACCEALFHENKQFLHVHHKDMQKSNVMRSNLICLCEVCHSKQPGHQHMRVAYADKRAIEKIRQAQGFAKTCPNCP